MNAAQVAVMWKQAEEDVSICGGSLPLKFARAIEAHVRAEAFNEVADMVEPDGTGPSALHRAATRIRALIKESE